MADGDRILDRFARLCETPSPVYAERPMADAVTAELRGLGLDVEEDDAGERIPAGAGNLLARIPGSGEGWLMLCAHIDTVPHEEPIAVELSDGVFRSRGETILGADNKAAVTVLLELAARHARDPAPVGLELLFTVAEEDALRGAKAFDVAKLRSPFGYVLDHATPIGEVITAAPTYKRLVADFDGQEAHAGMRPEDGHSAIAAAAAAIAEMKLGRLDEETTANVGVIHGGSASNVIPGQCRVEAEARSLDDERAAAVAGAMVEACSFGATEHGCDVDVSVEELFRGYRQSESSPAVAAAFAALRSRGHEPRGVPTGGGSDANAFVAAGFDCVNLANGTEANHTPQESVAAASILEMYEIAEALIAEVAAG
ncbi:MAG: tripeptide aminopeptidase [Solirubrobacterales bacterium]|jgi:tripeptide aminopeptidase|nr:tripeptide aminopeptidase [Solirubrobacterales bacterium]